MKKLLIIALLLLHACLLRAQNSADSFFFKPVLAKPTPAEIEKLLDLSDDKLSDKPDSALLLAQQAHLLAGKIHYEEGEARVLFIMGKVFKQKGNYPKALNLYRQSQKIYENLNDAGGIASNLLYTGEINAYQGDQRAALAYYFEAKKLFERDTADFAVASTLLKIGESYERRKLPDSALYFLNQIQELRHYKGHIAQFLGGRTLYAFGTVYVQKGRGELALNYFRESIPLLQNINEDRVICQVLLSMANLFEKGKKKSDSCLYYARRSLTIAEGAGFLLEIMNAADFLASYYKERRQPDSVLTYLQTSIEAKDSLFSREKIMSVQSQFFADERLKQELEEQQANLKNQGKILALIVTLFVVLIVLFLLWRNNKQKQKANVVLQRQKKEIQNTLSDLKAIQQQLIHAEKMASLGEVTAGIAHEIQNPLNFVTNFSDVGKELLAELKEELSAGRTAEAMLMVGELEQSLARINLHGNRADAIVKNMLQHSHNLLGSREPTDLNAMVEETLRLAYQAVRNKDHSFKANLQTHLDRHVGQVNLVPQEMGRVLLNLFNNAFYSVLQKKKQTENGYEPALQVSTHKVEGGCEIRVRDNGLGIPEKVIDKIYQPFFTTKPAGDGTGLGLSMSYDIVTKVHGGRLSVQTKQGEFAEFLIVMPIT